MVERAERVAERARRRRESSGDADVDRLALVGADVGVGVDAVGGARARGRAACGGRCRRPASRAAPCRRGPRSRPRRARRRGRPTRASRRRGGRRRVRADRPVQDHGELGRVLEGHADYRLLSETSVASVKCDHTPPRPRRPACWTPSRTAGRARPAVASVLVVELGAVDHEPAVAQLAPGALGAHDDRSPGSSTSRLRPATPAPGRSSSASEAQEGLRRHHAGVLAAGAPPARRRRSRARAPRRRPRSRRSSARETSRRLGHQRTPPRSPGTSRRRARAPRPRASQVYARATARPPRAQARARAPSSRATRASARRERLGVAGRAPAARSRRRPRKPRNTSRSEATTGSPAASASSDREPEALLDRGEGEDVGGAVEPLELASSAARRARARAPSRPSSRRARVRSARSRRGSRTASRRRPRAAAGRARAARRAQAAKPSSSVSEPLRGSIPPTVRTARRSPRPAASRAVAARSARVAGGPVAVAGRRRCRRARPRRRTRPRAARPTAARRTARGRARRSSGSWQATSDGEREVVDVVDGADHVPGSGRRRAARAPRWPRCSPARARCRSRRRASIGRRPVGVGLDHRGDRARRTATSGGSWRTTCSRDRAAGGRTRLAVAGRARSARPRARAAASASETSSACTTPPRGFTE